MTPSAAAASSTAAQTSPSFSRISYDVLLAHVLPCLDVRSLCQVSICCKTLQTLAESDHIWRPLTDARWKGKANVIPGRIFPRANFSEAALREMSVAELRLVCVALHINASPFREKGEFRQAIQISRRLLPPSERFGVPRGLKFKASYVCAELDSKRQVLSEQELTSSDWCFFFKHNPTSFTSTAKFLPDGRFVMSPWPMPNPESLLWRQNARGAVQIHHFPEHRPKRVQSNWSFTLENHHVIFYQIFPGFDAAAAQYAITAAYGQQNNSDEEDE